MTEEYHPKYAFLAYAIMGFILTIVSCFLSREAENEYNIGEEVVSQFSSELLSN
jgi:hypothetical protein